MRLHEGKFVKRCLIIYQEGSALSWRTLLNLAGWLGTYDADILNRTVLYISVWGDGGSNFSTADSLEVIVKSYGKSQQFTFQNVGLDSRSGRAQEKEFTILTIGNPSSPTDVLLTARATAWVIAETHRFMIEVHAYLLDVTPEEPIIRTF